MSLQGTETSIQRGRSPAGESIDASLRELDAHRGDWSRCPLDKRIALIDGCLSGVAEVAQEWVDAACRAKHIPPGSPLRAEEIGSGLCAVVRHLQLLKRSLRQSLSIGSPRLPGRLRKSTDGRLLVPVFPTGALFDSIVFFRLKAYVRMLAGIGESNLVFDTFGPTADQNDQAARICLVLGAGNVSSIPATDALSKLFQENKLVVLKMNPVNEYLAPVFSRAFAGLIEKGVLRIICGGAETGRSAVSHELVDEVHLTGSIATHDAIVWGPPGVEQAERRTRNDPLLKIPLTSELGNVSPWIVVPGRYSDRQLRFQAESIASSITNNCSFNCIATKVVVTCKEWPDRDRFLDMIDDVFEKTPRRYAYYPGAMARYQGFLDREPIEPDSDMLRWTLRRDADPDRSPRFFREESFVPICVETALSARDAHEFLGKATEFANDRLWGTLSAAITIPSGFRRSLSGAGSLAKCLADLRYGSVGINHWPGLIYATMSPPWGGFPGATLADAQSGIGWVHNTYGLVNAEKTILEGPLTLFPKPFWFPTHPNPEPVAWKLFRLSCHPTIPNLISLLSRATIDARPWTWKRPQMGGSAFP